MVVGRTVGLPATYCERLIMCTRIGISQRGASGSRSLYGLVLVVLLCALGAPSSAQFLSREYYPLWDEEYENYSQMGYRDYGAISDRPTYDPFGVYILDGLDILRMQQFRTLAPDEGSRLYRYDGYFGEFRNLVIMQDQYRGWSNKFMVGTDVPAQFSHLTLDVSILDGLRWDASAHKNRFSVITSRVSQPTGTLPFSTYLYGGHWESKLGDVLTIGASYVTLHHSDSMLREGSWRGDVPSDLNADPVIYVMFDDDSPEDHPGAVVYDVQMFVDGVRSEAQPEVRKLVGVTEFVGVAERDLQNGVRRPANFPVASIAHARRGEAWVPRIRAYDRIFDSKLFDETKGLFFTQGVPVSGEGPLEVSGTDLLIYRYEIPREVQRIHFKALVAGDYSIEVSRDYEVGRTALTWNDGHNVKRAPGNVRDQSNLGWITFDYGFPVGVMQYSGQLGLNFLGFRVNAEYADHFDYARFPASKGRQQTAKSSAYFVNMVKDMGTWTLGGELFRMPPTYRTSLKYWSELPAGGPRALTYELIDDNDDADDWPDSWEHWDPVDTRYNLQSSYFDITEPMQDARDRGYNRSVGQGVFPGLDENGDGVLDINVNENETPDYAEPFLMYYVEPDPFVYGDDFNHNGVVDARENDNLPDYPYNLDSRGYHAFAQLKPRDRLDIRVGYYDVRQMAGEGRNRSTYVKAEYSIRREGLGTVGLYYTGERVYDSIRDPVYQVVITPLAQKAQNIAIDVRSDPLLMRNSTVHRAFLSTGYTGIKGLNVVNKILYERNGLHKDSFEDGTSQSDAQITRSTLVSKADYTYRFGDLSVTPMVKFMLERQKASDRVVLSRHTYTLFPIIRAAYRLSPKTTVKLGVQGLSGFKHRFRNPDNASEDSDATHYILAVQHRSMYAGYGLGISLGYRSTRTEWVGLPDAPVRRFRELFIQAWVE